MRKVKQLKTTPKVQRTAVQLKRSQILPFVSQKGLYGLYRSNNWHEAKKQ